MDSEKILVVVAIVAVVVSLLATGFTYFSVVDLASKITGFAGSTGSANLTVESSLSVNFTTHNVSFGSGRVDSGSTAASLSTDGSGNVVGGNWTATTGLIFENIGNVNVTLNLSGAQTAAAFIGGTNPAYRYNVSQSEANSCSNTSGGTTVAHGVYRDVDTTVNYTFCDPFVFHATSDELRIDFNITIPEDSSTGALGDVITATAYT
jgi:hypothetical protein